MKNIVAVALAVVFVMALAVPAFAMTHDVEYEMDGIIDFKKQAGHACNTGGVHKQVITGSGEMSKAQSIVVGSGELTMSDVNDYVAGETSLTVTSVIELCAPPKYTYDGEDSEGNTITAPVHVDNIYGSANSMPASFKTDGNGAFDTTASGTTHEQLAKQYGWDALTDQIWAVQVQADPGYSGNLHQDFTAAQGPWYSGESKASGYDSWYADDTAWGAMLVDNEYDNARRTPGPEYVGSYFDMDQHARTSMGTVQRYIDISSPVDHGYLHEDMSVEGKSEINETFNMTQIAPGADVPGDWWDLF